MDHWTKLMAVMDERNDLRAVLNMAKSALQQGGNIHTRIAGNGPSIGEVIDRVLATGSLSATKEANKHGG